MLKRPNPGDVVTVTTRYPNDYYYATSPWRDTTYENVPVMEPPRKLKPNEFAIPCTGEKYLTYRVINMKYVKDMVIIGRTADKANQSIVTKEVKGSKGKTYTVTIENEVAVSCTCPGFQFRKQCRHLNEVSVDLNTVDRDGKQGDPNVRGKQTVVRKEKTTMSKLKELGWNERFAVFDALGATDEQIMGTLGIDKDELAMARDLRAAGTFVPSLGNLNADDFADEVRSVSVAVAPATDESVEAPTPARATARRPRKADKPASATKATKQPQKRGRKGNKIAEAFAAIGPKPVPLDEVAQKFAISTNVLRQSKRFDRSPELGRVVTKTIDGKTCIFRKTDDE